MKIVVQNWCGIFLFALVAVALGCDCNYHPGGCQVSSRAPDGYACRCSYKGFYTCGGSVVGCLDANSQYCQHPDLSYHSCVQGGGDCDGY